MIIEYLGEVIPSPLADVREKYYESVGIGSSYLFRIDDRHVIDATRKGNMCRFLNHSCEPNVFPKIITVGNKKRIVIYAKNRILIDEELVMDYHLPLEPENKIPCLCGAKKCKGFLN